MVYTQGTDFIGNTEECRRLARNAVDADFTDDEIKSYQYKVYSVIRTVTDFDSWNATHREFGALQLIETEWTAELLNKHFGDGQEATVSSANANIAALIAQLSGLVANIDTTTTETELEIQVTEAKSWNKNPNVEVPRGNLTIV